MNRWKVLFWISFILLILVSLLSVYSILDQGVTLTYQKEGYISTEKDLEQIIDITLNTDLSKDEIKRELKDNRLFEFMNFEEDTIALERVLLIFENEKLKEIKKQW
jgi:hypothetical protein